MGGGEAWASSTWSHCQVVGISLLSFHLPIQGETTELLEDKNLLFTHLSSLVIPYHVPKVRSQ